MTFWYVCYVLIYFGQVQRLTLCILMDSPIFFDTVLVVTNYAKCANRNKSGLLFLSAEMFKKPLIMVNSVGPDQTCSCRSSLFWVHAVCFYT